MTLPPFLVAEVRLAFKTCARQHAATRQRPFSTAPVVWRKASKHPAKPSRPVSAIPEPKEKLLARTEDNTRDVPDTSRPASTELVPRKEDGKALDGNRTVNVPLRALPKEQITPALKISPRERLHLERLTRQPPPPVAQKIFKPKLLIYHIGYARMNWMALSKFCAIFAASFMTIIWVPAYYYAGTPIYILAPVWAASFFPAIVLNWIFRPVIVQIWLNLPHYAQQSANAAMTYAKTLPKDASVTVSFMRWTLQAGKVHIRLADTIPTKKKWPPATFKWIGPGVERGNIFRSNPTEYYVRNESAKGKAARLVTPGLWGKVYERLTGLNSAVKSRWWK